MVKWASRTEPQHPWCRERFLVCNLMVMSSLEPSAESWHVVCPGTWLLGSTSHVESGRGINLLSTRQ